MAKRGWLLRAHVLPGLAGDGPEEPLLVGDDDDIPGELSPNGRVLAFNREAAGTARDIWIMPLDGAQAEVFRATNANERDPAFAPDGRWIAYASDESGQFEIWLQSYPDTARARLLITTGGGQGPLWGPDGELFYHNGDQMMSVLVDLATGSPNIPEEIFEGTYRYLNRNYDVTPDGETLLMVKPRTEEERREVVVVLNWFEELKERMGGNWRLVVDPRSDFGLDQ